MNDQAKEFSLNARDIQIKKVNFQGQAPIEIRYDLKYHNVTFVFDKPFTLGEHKVHIDYIGQLNNDMAGFYRCK